MSDSGQNSNLWSWVKALSTVAVTFVICYKVVETEVKLTLDFPTLLSLLLALFSIGLAALFYFKATETSNTFYHNTHHFTRDIAQLLAKMESGFGEKLGHLEEGYSAMRDNLHKYGTPVNLDAVKKKVANEEEEMNKAIADRDEHISNLLAKTQLQDKEKEKFLKELEKKEKDVAEARLQLEFVKNRLERVSKKNAALNRLDIPHAHEYTLSDVVPHMHNIAHIAEAPYGVIEDTFNWNNWPRQYLHDLEKMGYYDTERESITREGVEYLRKMTLKTHPSAQPQPSPM